ncbi:hypothetical protein TNCV_1430831 [Trichonephila clavipes]|nr:hypothetical protein TNCV_1430831 [Trichonephila clavipes]
MIFYVVGLLDDCNVDVPSWKYPRNLESPRVSSPGFSNDSKMMVIIFDSELDRGLPCHEFEPSTTKYPPCRVAMHVKSVES